VVFKIEVLTTDGTPNVVASGILNW